MNMKSWVVAAVGTLALAGQVRAESALADRIQAGDREAALEMIRKRVDVNARQADGTTPLHWAVYKVDAELVKALLARGAKPNVVNHFGSSPLAEAVKIADLEIIRMLLKAGADVEAPNQDGQTALMLAVRTGVFDVVKLLVDHGANVNAVEQWRGQTPLMWAAADGKPEIVELLVKKGADVNARAVVNDWENQITSEPRAQYKPSGGLTPLLYAARAGCLRCVSALLDGGADINKPNPDGVTPLMIAIDNQHYDVAKYLLEKGANPHTWDWWGRTALYIAVDMNSFINRFGPGGGGDAPPSPARTKGKTTALDIARMLLEAGVNPNPQLNMHRPGRGGNSGRFTDDGLTTGTTPLLRAAFSHDIAAAKLLLEHGALVDLPNVMGVTPLMAAAGMSMSPRDLRRSVGGDVQAKAIAMIDLFLAAGADVNARVTDTASHTARIARPSSMTNRQGQTALYGAINWGWTRVVQHLIDKGAKVDVKDAAGKTLLDAVAGNAGGRDHQANEEIAALIKKATATVGA